MEDASTDLWTWGAGVAGLVAGPWLAIGLRRARQSIPAPAGIGPHEGRELELLLSGRKPLALVHGRDFRGFDAAVQEGKLIAAAVRVSVPYQREGVLGWLLRQREHGHVELRFYARTAEEGRLKTICGIFHDRCGSGFTVYEHATIGWLLGYSDMEIATFLEHWQRQPTR